MVNRVLVISDGGAPTGYARVTHGILRNLPKGEYDVHHLAVNYNGDPHGEDWKMYPAIGGGDVYGINRIKDLIEKVQPALVLAAQDLWIQREYLKVLAPYAEKLKIVLYSPVDAGPVDPEWLEQISCVSRLVMFTEYARKEVLKALEGKEAPRVDVIPLGVDTKTFFPYAQNGVTIAPEERMRTVEAKRKLKLLDEGSIEDSFIVLNAHRNQPRKRIDITMKGFALFARDKPPNVQLYLHMGTTDSGWNVLKLAKRYGIDDRLILTDNKNTIPGVSSENLNLIYNACDVGINTATGEGWGLPNFEHAATGKAQVVPRFGACAEIWSEAAEFLEPETEIVYEGVLSEGKMVSAEDVACALERLYTDRGYLTKVASSCYERATRPEFHWIGIALKWHNLFQEVLGGHN
jgi:D-inositol-3-phosphate glycosyltransferase